MRWFALFLFLVAGMTSAQDYPARPLHLVLPQPPGGAVDFISRTLGATLQKSMGQAIVVDNKPGANGIVAAEFVAKAPADGYTLFMAVDTNLVVNPNLYAKVPYDPFRDFAPISVIARNGLVLVAKARQDHDNRSVKVTTTAKGRAVARKCHDTAVKHDRVLTRGLRAAEVRALKSTLQQLYSNVKS